MPIFLEFVKCNLFGGKLGHRIQSLWRKSTIIVKANCDSGLKVDELLYCRLSRMFMKEQIEPSLYYHTTMFILFIQGLYKLVQSCSLKYLR